MVPATEIACLPLLPGTDLDDVAVAATWRAALDTIAAQPGFQRMVWGHQIENPDTLQMCIDWDSVEAHQKFVDSPAYQPFLKDVGALLSGAPALSHVHFDTPPTAAFSAPVTELVSLFFPSSYNPAELIAPWQEFQEAATQHAEGLVAAATGWGVEEVEHKSLRAEQDKDKEGAKGTGKVFLAAIGWESIDKPMQYRETQAFKETILKLRVAVKGIEIHHVAFKAH